MTNTWYFLKPTNAAALAKIKTAIKKERPPPSACSNSRSPEFVKVWHKFTPNSKVLFCLKSWPQIKSFQRMRAELIYSIITRPNWARKVRELLDFWGGWTEVIFEVLMDLKMTSAGRQYVCQIVVTPCFVWFCVIFHGIAWYDIK